MSAKFYKWTLSSDCTYTKEGVMHNVTAIPLKWATFWISDDGEIHSIAAKHGYSWDGCTPSVKFFGGKLGAWDGRKVKLNTLTFRSMRLFNTANAYNNPMVQELYYASLFHDVLCQYKDHLNISQKEIDHIFLDLARDSGFPLPGAYYSGIRIYQGLARILS